MMILSASRQPAPAPHIFAAGDVIGHLMLKSAAFFGEVHPHARRRFLERLDGAGVSQFGIVLIGCETAARLSLTHIRPRPRARNH